MSIYFLKAGDFVAYKIGFTSGDPIKRMCELQVGCPFRLELLGCIEGTFEEEQALHALLDEFKTSGEWFEPHSVVTATIKHQIENGISIALKRRRPKNQNRACEIIDLLGGNGSVGKLTGGKPSAVSNWRRLGQFPSNTFVIMRDALAERGIEADPDLWAMISPSETRCALAATSPRASGTSSARTRSAQQEGFQA